MIEVLLSQAKQDAAGLLETPLRHPFVSHVDLSVSIRDDRGFDLYDFVVLEAYIQRTMQATNAKVLWGGYLERRSLYLSSPLFQNTAGSRDIHLGIDFWTQADTPVFAPLPGTVHSFQDNAGFKDYGPTIVLRHEFQGVEFHTLYGHLSRESLLGLTVGQPISKGQRLAMLGTPAENGNWPPHLHFQIIVDMQGHSGDYPGVCTSAEVAQFVNNCPDPSLLLGL